MNKKINFTYLKLDGVIEIVGWGVGSNRDKSIKERNISGRWHSIKSALILLNMSYYRN
jgi:hypothetical protein